MTYLATAQIDTLPVTSDQIGDTYKLLAPCCKGHNIYLARVDCWGVACFTNDRPLAEQWANCVAANNRNISTFASKIDYGYYRSGKTSSAPTSNTKKTLLGACILGSIFFMGF